MVASHSSWSRGALFSNTEAVDSIEKAKLYSSYLKHRFKMTKMTLRLVHLKLIFSFPWQLNKNQL